MEKNGLIKIIYLATQRQRQKKNGKKLHINLVKSCDLKISFEHIFCFSILRIDDSQNEKSHTRNSRRCRKYP